VPEGSPLDTGALRCHEGEGRALRGCTVAVVQVDAHSPNPNPGTNLFADVIYCNQGKCLIWPRASHSALVARYANGSVHPHVLILTRTSLCFQNRISTTMGIKGLTALISEHAPKAIRVRVFALISTALLDASDATVSLIHTGA